MEKLIRDKLDKVIPPNELRICENKEYNNLLLAKLDEELEELSSSDYADVAEYADVIEVLFAIAKYHNINKADIMSKRIEKLYERGGFDMGLILTRDE